jgi:hypothetical protein
LIQPFAGPTDRRCVSLVGISSSGDDIGDGASGALLSAASPISSSQEPARDGTGGFIKLIYCSSGFRESEGVETETWEAEKVRLLVPFKRLLKDRSAEGWIGRLGCTGLT